MYITSDGLAVWNISQDRMQYQTVRADHFPGMSITTSQGVVFPHLGDFRCSDVSVC